MLEAIKGIGSEGVALITLYLIIKDVVIPLIKRNKNKNNNPRKQGERIAKLEKGQENIEGRLDKIEDKLFK